MRVIDTGGLDVESDNSIGYAIQNQLERTIHLSQIIIYMLDSNSGLNSLDETYLKLIRKSYALNGKGNTLSGRKDIIVLINELDGARSSSKIYDIMSDVYQLGMGDPFVIGARTYCLMYSVQITL